LAIGGNAPRSSRIDTDHAPFRDLKLVAVHLEAPLAFDNEIDFLIPLVGVKEGHADAWGQFIDGEFRTGESKLVVERDSSFGLNVSD